MNFWYFVMRRVIDDSLEYFFILWERRKKKWRNLIGREKSILISAIKNASIFHAIRMQIRMILTVCSVIARYMPWVRNAVGISGIRKRELKTAQTVCFRISEKTMGMSQENTRNWLIWWKEQRKVSANKRRMRRCLERSEQ